MISTTLAVARPNFEGGYIYSDGPGLTVSD
jgi:hypothetical protein